jgi:hypothetical protein
VIDDDLVVAGYVLTVPSDAPPGMATVPTSIVTISDCIMPTLPRPRSWDWFEDLDEVERAQAAHAPAAQITAVAMRPADAAAFMDEMGGAGQPYFTLLSQSVRFDGAVQGYEVVGAEATLDFHSWHCHGYADEVSEALGIHVNNVGLLPTYSVAAPVLTWMLDRPASEAPAPVPWVVVALGPVDR